MGRSSQALGTRQIPSDILDSLLSRKASMTLAPIRGAPPGAPIPDFPIEEPRAKPAELVTTQPSDDQSPIPPIRRRYAPVDIGGGGIVLTFRVIPEQPAIARASMTIHVAAGAIEHSSWRTPRFLRMSAANARAFLTDLRNGCSQIAAAGDEGGTVQIEFSITDAWLILMVRSPGERHALRRCVINRGLDLQGMATELLADLGA